MRYLDYSLSGLLFLFYCTLYAQNVPLGAGPEEKKVSQVFYALGDMGEGDIPEMETVIRGLKKTISDKRATILVLGNTSSEGEITASELHQKTRKRFDLILKGLEPSSDKIYFLPGNTDWKNGLAGILTQQNYIRSQTRGNSRFLPEDGCPLKKIKVNDQVDLLLLDSQWVLQDWDKEPKLNANCDIRLKEDFFVEIESEVVKSQNKVLLIAMHHPIASNGKYGNRFSFGIDPQSINNKHYKELSDRLLTIGRQWNNVFLIAAHDNNLQFLKEKGIPIIVSGSGSKIAHIKNKNSDERFSASELGFAKITVYTDTSVRLSFFGASNAFKAPIYEKEISKKYSVPEDSIFEKNVPKTISKSIYEKKDLERTQLNDAIYGKHYKEDYTTKIKIRTAYLDTLYGGLTVVRKGGGHQTNSLRLKNSKGKEYVMRSLEKSAVRFLQYFVYKTQYLDPALEHTYLVRILQDFWTTANPYGVLTISELSDALKILHPNPKLFYIPKQDSLGKYNSEFGDKIYLIEERLTDGHKDVESLGYSEEIISTFSLLEKLRSRHKVSIDKKLYIRTRLFDNLIGDWDRHADQLKWTKEAQSDGTNFYRPIPRDRDQAYSDFDGFLLRSLTKLTPVLRFMQRYTSEYKYTKWFNDAGDDVDLAVLDDHSLEDWLIEAKFIKQNLTKAIIDQAFDDYPEELNQSKKRAVKKAFLGRLSNIEENARNMFNYLSKYVLVNGTDGKDSFKIHRKPNGITQIVGHHTTDAKPEKEFWNATYSDKTTKEIWIYGLDNDDTFEVQGQGDSRINIKIIGGRGKDTYNVGNKRKIKVYDYKSMPNDFLKPVRKTLSDNYELNTYYFKRHHRVLNNTIPLLSYEPDNGLGIGAQFNSIKNSLYQNPFSTKHSISLHYFTGTSGIDFKYNGEFAHILKNVNLSLETRYTSPRHIVNFYGFGNNTPNFEDDLDFEFNRVRLQTISFAPALVFRGYQESEVKLGLSYEYKKVERTEDRFITTTDVNPNIFEGQHFFGTVLTYAYSNFDSAIKPKQGLGFALTAGYTANFEENRSFGYVIPELRITSKIDNRGIFTYATKFKGHINLNEEYEFHQAASIGAFDGLRGFRQQRFSGKQSYYQNSDLRITLGRLNNGLLPIVVSIYGGFDYGRVWQPGEDQNIWHTSSGGGFYFNLAGYSTANFAYFRSADGGRFAFRMFFPF